MTESPVFRFERPEKEDQEPYMIQKCAVNYGVGGTQKSVEVADSQASHDLFSFKVPLEQNQLEETELPLPPHPKTLENQKKTKRVDFLSSQKEKEEQSRPQKKKKDEKEGGDDERERETLQMEDFNVSKKKPGSSFSELGNQLQLKLATSKKDLEARVLAQYQDLLHSISLLQQVSFAEQTLFSSPQKNSSSFAPNSTFPVLLQDVMEAVPFSPPTNIFDLDI